MRCLWTQTARQPPGGSSPPYARVTALWRNSSESLRFMDPPPDLATLALLITLSRQYTHSSMKASTTLSHADHLGRVETQSLPPQQHHKNPICLGVLWEMHSCSAAPGAPESSWELLDAHHETRSTLGAFWRCTPALLLLGAPESLLSAPKLILSQNFTLHACREFCCKNSDSVLTCYSSSNTSQIFLICMVGSRSA